MAQDMDDATFALIQQMVQDDNPYAYDDYYGGKDNDSGDDSDYGGSSKAKRKKKQPKGSAKVTKRSAAPKAAAGGGDADGNDENKPGADPNAADGGADTTASGRRRRKDAGKERQKARAWTDDEERLFQEALELHGRDWKKCAEHVGTRDPKSFTSHAQKYFIKLCLQGKRLPAKVAESGEGYTLSGKALDPNSAAAKAYGFKPDSLQQIKDTEAAAGVDLTTGQHGAAVEGAGDASAAAASSGDAGGHQQQQGATGGPNGKEAGGQQPAADAGKEEAAGKQQPAATKPKPKARAKPATAPEPPSPAADEAPAEPTEYAKNRPRREVKKRANYGHTTESLELMKCCDYVGPPGCGAPLAQPFKVTVDPQALLLMDLHSHLSSCEVIGLLGGRWDPDCRSITVVKAFPCKRADGSDSGTSVELDPEAEVATRALMEQQKLVPVGWYHSHPIFEPRPSAKDAENQRNYQALFRCQASGAEPFVGAIVGPYDSQLPSEASAVRWFVVQHKGGLAEGLAPYNVVAARGAPAALPGVEEEAALMAVIDMFKEDIGRIDFREMWRAFRRVEDGVPCGGMCTKLAKLRSALAAHLPDGASPRVEAPAIAAEGGAQGKAGGEAEQQGGEKEGQEEQRGREGIKGQQKEEGSVEKQGQQQDGGGGGGGALAVEALLDRLCKHLQTSWSLELGY